ncbi:helix-turn-helix domain-containing protein [Paenibacillus sinopodophylli]|uniref:helix-turn-helix domain-containing protein n=1 Tax=Paenibacillus sinopodophylli TaxID=1837342 RepID=UPI00110D159E|nr:helix-turn-helix domain-containing protein [Paenibacillus sinopodophylli]
MSNVKKNKAPLFAVYTSREAAELWGLSENTVTKWCNRGKFNSDEARKSGKVWLVTHDGMVRLAEKEPHEEE